MASAPSALASRNLAIPLKAPRVWRGFARIGAALASAFDVFAEAQMQAIAAHKRYPFVDW